MSLLFAFALTPVASALTLDPLTPLRVGTRNTSHVTGAAAGARITFAYGVAAGNTAVPNCPGVTVPIARPTVLATVVASASGEASFVGYVPASTSGLTVRVVAVDTSRCEVSNTTVDTFPDVTWADVEPLLATRCSACHYNAPPPGQGNFLFSDASDLVGVASVEVPAMVEVEPFLPDDSYLFHKIVGTHLSVGGSGVRMPQGGPYLSQSDADLVEQWILDGAQP